MNQSEGSHSETKGIYFKRLAWPTFVVVVVVTLLLVVWKLPQRQASILKQRIESEEGNPISREKLFELENTTRENYLKVIQSFGGLGFLLTGYFAWRNLQTAEKNRELAERTAETNRINAEENRDFAERTAEVNRKLAEDKQVTERFSKAVELLSEGDKLEARIGGIYLLERIAKDSPNDQETVMEVLTAFVRENASLQKSKTISLDESSNNESHEKSVTKEVEIPEKITPNTDIQAILTVIRRQKWEVIGKIDLSGANLRGANLSGANLSGANLRKADLRKADLSEARLHRANLRKADLLVADLSRADLIGADLLEADLSEAKEITPDQIKEAKNWQTAAYRDDIAARLGLSTAPEESEEKLEE